MKVNRLPGTNLEKLEPKVKIKRIARQLIAEQGVRNVTVREIAQAANQRNQGVVAYYFGTKDKLLAEILTDGAERIEARRLKFLEKMEAEGGLTDVRQAIEAIILPCTEFSDEDEVYGRYFNRFLFRVSLSDPGFTDETLKGRWSVGYQACLNHLRRLLPHLTPVEQNRRFVFLGGYVSQMLAQREVRREDLSKDHPTWNSDDTLDDIIRTASALVKAD